MAVHGGAGDEPGWLDLPRDLLSTIYLGCVSAYDRARFAAVCTSWRAVVGWHRRLPALPLLLPTNDGVRRDLKSWAYSPEDGRALRFPALRSFIQGHRLVGSHEGGWIATISWIDQLCIVNLFTGARGGLSSKQRYIECACPLSLKISVMANVQKVAFSTDPTSGSCILAALTRHCDIALCKVGCRDSGWTTHACGTDRYWVIDITFFRGELYGFTSTQLFKFNIGLDKYGAPVANPMYRVDVAMSALRVFGGATYIFELHGRLAIAVKVYPERRHQNIFFRVFDLDEGDTTWKEVCCWERKDGHSLEKILSRGYYYVEGGNGCISCMWLWPPEF